MSDSCQSGGGRAMFERVGFGSCPTITAPCPPPSPRRDFNLKHDHCASCVDRPLHQRGVPEMDLTAACAQANPAAAAVQCGMPCTLDPNGKNVDFPESLFWGRAVLPVISMMLLMILVAAGRTLEMAAAVASLEVGTQAVAAMALSVPVVKPTCLLASRGEWLHRCARAAVHLSTLGGERANKSELLWRWCFWG